MSVVLTVGAVALEAVRVSVIVSGKREEKGVERHNTVSAIELVK